MKFRYKMRTFKLKALFGFFNIETNHLIVGILISLFVFMIGAKLYKLYEEHEISKIKVQHEFFFDVSYLNGDKEIIATRLKVDGLTGLDWKLEQPKDQGGCLIFFDRANNNNILQRRVCGLRHFNLKSHMIDTISKPVVEKRK